MLSGAASIKGLMATDMQPAPKHYYLKGKKTTVSHNTVTVHNAT